MENLSDIDAQAAIFISCSESIAFISENTLLQPARLVRSDKNITFSLLQALYTQYLQFKEHDIPLKENEKTKIQNLYKMLEVCNNISQARGVFFTYCY